MLATTHVLVGAGTGEVVSNPYLAFVASVIVHFIIDKIPHFWPAKLRDQILLNAVEWTTAFVIFMLLLTSSIPNKSSVLAGALGGVIVDIVLAGLPYFYKRKIGTWHSGRQPHKTEPVYLVTDLLFIVPLVIYFSTRG